MSCLVSCGVPVFLATFSSWHHCVPTRVKLVMSVAPSPRSAMMESRLLDVIARKKFKMLAWWLISHVFVSRPHDRRLVTLIGIWLHILSPVYVRRCGVPAWYMLGAAGAPKTRPIPMKAVSTNTYVRYTWDAHSAPALYTYTSSALIVPLSWGAV
jgi:hypothetical protein